MTIDTLPPVKKKLGLEPTHLDVLAVVGSHVLHDRGAQSLCLLPVVSGKRLRRANATADG